MTFKTFFFALAVASAATSGPVGAAQACSRADIDAVGRHHTVEIDQARGCSWIKIRQRGAWNEAIASSRGRAKIAIKQSGTGNRAYVNVSR